MSQLDEVLKNKMYHGYLNSIQALLWWHNMRWYDLCNVNVQWAYCEEIVTMCPEIFGLIKVLLFFIDPFSRRIHSCSCFPSYLTVPTLSVLTNPVLCSKWLISNKLVWILKLPPHSSPHSSTLALIGALKWGTVWSFISTSIGITEG